MNFRVPSSTRSILSMAMLSVPLSLLMLSACGGGGGSSAATSSPPTPINFANGQAAAVVVGQPDFTSNTAASGVAGLNYPYTNANVSAGKLYITDYSNNRVMVFNSIPVSNGASADYALGQPDLTTTTAGVSATAISGPQSPVIADGKFFVAEYDNNRISIYNSVPTGSPGTIDVVAGQTDKVSNANSCSAIGLFSPETVSVAGGKMVVADGSNNRVLIWNSIPTADGTPADLVLGQPDMTTCSVNSGGSASASTISYAAGAWTDGTRLVVLDEMNNRVLIWNSFPTSNGQAADLVLGQPDFTSVSANQGGAASSSTLKAPYEGVYVHNDQLFVTDSDNNRVLVWNSFPTSNDQAADLVLGQPDFVTTTFGTSDTTLYRPVGVYVSGTQLFVTDSRNHRVLIYNGN